MKIPSDDIIQADTLDRVLACVDIVAAGASTDDEIASGIGELSSRQGRYYRRAAEILGLIGREGPNQSTLTSIGRRLADLQGGDRVAVVRNLVLSNPVFYRLITFIEAQEGQRATRDQLADFLRSVASLGAASMAQRRVASYISWLRGLDIVSVSGVEVSLVKKAELDSPIIVKHDDEPLLPSRFDLKEYETVQMRVAGAGPSLAYFVDQAKLERADNSHRTLTNLLAGRIRDCGGIPRENTYIDLATQYEGWNYVFEMKSTTEANWRSQARRGLSQLYEYRYLQNIDKARLVLVMEAAPPSGLEWFVDYLRDDRGVAVIWDGDGNLYSPTKSLYKLPFVN